MDDLPSRKISFFANFGGDELEPTTKTGMLPQQILLPHGDDKTKMGTWFKNEPKTKILVKFHGIPENHLMSCHHPDKHWVFFLNHWS